MESHDKNQVKLEKNRVWRKANRVWINAYHAKWRKANPDKIKRIRQKDECKNAGKRQIRYYEAHTSKILTQRKIVKANHFERHLYNHLRRRAIALGIAFNLRLEDIIIPRTCPILGIPIIIGGGSKCINNAPSADRFNPKGGYTRKNTRIVSMRANTLKNNATVKELEKLLKYMKNYDR